MVLVRNSRLPLDDFRFINVSGPADISQSDVAGLSNSQDEGFRRSLDDMSIDAIRAATHNNPTDFLCPYVADLCRSPILWVPQSAIFLRGFSIEVDTKDLEFCATRMEFADDTCAKNINSLKRYMKGHPETRTPAMLAALEELQLVQGIMKEHLGRCQAKTSRLVSIMSLRESRRSIEQSVSTRRLTQLAYIFLPLSLSTSAFGMNVAPVQNVQIWVFFVTSFALLLGSLSVWYWFDWISGWAHWLSDWAWWQFDDAKIFCRTYITRKKTRPDQNTRMTSPLP